MPQTAWTWTSAFTWNLDIENLVFKCKICNQLSTNIIINRNNPSILGLALKWSNHKQRNNELMMFKVTTKSKKAIKRLAERMPSDSQWIQLAFTVRLTEPEFCLTIWVSLTAGNVYCKWSFKSITGQRLGSNLPVGLKIVCLSVNKALSHCHTRRVGSKQW